MPHFLYRPHIRVDGKVLTIDFLLRSATLVDDTGDQHALPVDLLNCHIDLEHPSEDMLVAPALFRFIGDTDSYVAPAICVLDRTIFEYNAQLAWRNARISVSRSALKSEDMAQWSWPMASSKTIMPTIHDDIIGKRQALVRILSQPIQPAAPMTEISTTIHAAETITHICNLLPIGGGGLK